MFISEALAQLLGAPTMYGWRPTGEIIQVSNYGRIRAVRPGGLGEFKPKVTDLMANDWQVGPIEKLKRVLAAAAQQEQA